MAADPLDIIAGICHEQPHDALEQIAQALGFTEARERSIRDEGFNMGTIAALACVRAQDCGVTWREIVCAAGTQDVLRHALTHEGDWTWAGFDHYAVAELGQKEITKARRTVAAAKRRAGGVAEAPEPLSLEAGKSYLDEGGQRVKITRRSGLASENFHGDNGSIYSRTGHGYYCAPRLIREADAGVTAAPAPSLPPLPEAMVMVRDTDDEPEGGGWIVDCDCEGPLSYSLEAGEALYTTNQMREYALIAAGVDVGQGGTDGR